MFINAFHFPAPLLLQMLQKLCLTPRKQILPTHFSPGLSSFEKEKSGLWGLASYTTAKALVLSCCIQAISQDVNILQGPL